MMDNLFLERCPQCSPTCDAIRGLHRTACWSLLPPGIYENLRTNCPRCSNTRVVLTDVGVRLAEVLVAYLVCAGIIDSPATDKPVAGAECPQASLR